MVASVTDGTTPAGVTLSLTEALRRLARHREPDAWEALLHHSGADIQRVTRRILNDTALSEDACQETLLQIRAHAASFIPPQALAEAQLAARVWIMRIAANCALRMSRSRTRMQRREALSAANEPPHETPAPETRKLREEQVELLRREVAGLPDTLREPVALRFFAEMDYVTIAQALSCSPGAVKKRVERGLERLRARLAMLGLILSLGDLALHLSGGAAAQAAEAAMVPAAQKLAWNALLKSSSAPAFANAVPLAGLSIAVKCLLAAAALLFVGTCVGTGYYFAPNDRSASMAVSTMQVAADAAPPTEQAAAPNVAAPAAVENPQAKRRIFVPAKSGRGAAITRLEPRGPDKLWFEAEAGIGDQFPVNDHNNKHRFDMLVDGGDDARLSVKILSKDGTKKLDLIRDKAVFAEIEQIQYAVSYLSVYVALAEKTEADRAMVVVTQKIKPVETPPVAANPYVKQLVFVPAKTSRGASWSALGLGPGPGTLWVHASAGIGDKFPVDDELGNHRFDLLVDGGNNDYLAIKIFSKESTKKFDLVRDKPLSVQIGGIEYEVLFPTIEVNLQEKSTTDQATVIVTQKLAPGEMPPARKEPPPPEAKDEFEGQMVRTIEIRGLQRVSESTVLKTIRTRKGRPYEQKVWEDDWHRLDDSGFFRDIRATAPVKVPDGVGLTIDLVEKPAAKTEAQPGAVPTAAEVTAKLASLWNTVKSFSATADNEIFLEIPGRPEEFHMNYHAKYDLVLDGANVYCKELKAAPPEEPYLSTYIRNGNQFTLWQRHENEVLGHARIWPATAPEMSNLNNDVMCICPWRDLSVHLFGFDPRKHTITVVGPEQFRFRGQERAEDGIPAIRAEWKGSWDCSVLLSRGDLLPIRLEQHAGKELTCTAEYAAMKKIGDIFVPTELVYRQTMLAKDAREGFNPDPVPAGVPDDAKIIYASRYRLANVQINPAVKPEQFEIKWAKGTQVTDHIKGTNVLWEEYDLNSKKSLKKEPEIKREF